MWATFCGPQFDPSLVFSNIFYFYYGLKSQIIQGKLPEFPVKTVHLCLLFHNLMDAKLMCMDPSLQCSDILMFHFLVDSGGFHIKPFEIMANTQLAV